MDPDPDPDPDEKNAEPQPWLAAAVVTPNHGCGYDCGPVVTAAVAVVTRHEMGGVVGCMIRHGSGIRESEAVSFAFRILRETEQCIVANFNHDRKMNSTFFEEVRLRQKVRISFICLNVRQFL